MCLHQVSGRGNRTQEPYDSTFNALPLSYPHRPTFLWACGVGIPYKKVLNFNMFRIQEK